VKVVFVNRYFHPDLAPTGRLAAEVAFDLAAAGREVHVVTSRLRYDGPAQPYPAEETIAGVRVHRVWTSSFGRRNLPGRAIDYATFYAGATAKLLRLLSAGDLVIAMTDPPLISACAALAASLRSARTINWQQDIFPEIASELGFHALGPLLRGVRTWSLRRAAMNVAVGERMARRLREIGGSSIQVRVIHNWADGERIRPIASETSALRHTWGAGDSFVAGYCGNMGRVHDLATILAACARLKDDSTILFAFVGGGAKKWEVEEAVRTHALANVRLQPYVDDTHLGDALGACDVHLISLLPRLEGLVVPSKFYGIAAAGRPMIFVGDPEGEIGKLISSHQLGATVRPGDVDGFVAALLEAKRRAPERAAAGERARRAFKTEWDKRHALARWRAVVAAVAP
jgi:colanic acid biosynthesis glycosyl transferase WcaI